jgi:putative transposase
MKILEMQTAIKGYGFLHTKGIYHVYRKYMFARTAMFRSIKTKHKNSDKVKLPYKEKKFFNSGWDYQSIQIDYENKLIKLSRKIINDEMGKRKRQGQVVCHTKSIPQNIIEIELLYRDGFKLAIKYKEPDIQNVIQSDNVAAIDLGEIHSITSIDNHGNAIIITGRKIRSIKRLRDKEQAKIRSKISKCTKGSRQYKKYSKALYSIKYKTDKKIHDAIHKTTKLYLDFCLENNISKIYYGNLDSATRNTHGRVNKFIGQKLNEWNYGLIMIQLHNKLNRYGVELVEVDEFYTSQKCPACGELNKPSGREYVCNCGYHQHRDIVGAINILNYNAGTQISKYTHKKYLQIA